jgi:hypothetical protein
VRSAIDEECCNATERAPSSGGVREFRPAESVRAFTSAVHAPVRPWRIDFHDDLPESLLDRDTYSPGSLTGMTFLSSAILSAMLGVTAGRGNSVDEIIKSLTASTAAHDLPLDTGLGVAASALGPSDVVLHATAHLAGVAVTNPAPVTVTVTK